MPQLHPAITQVGEYRIERTLAGNRGRVAINPSGRQVVLKPLEAACLRQGLLHPDVARRLCRVRELAVAGVANLISVERDDAGEFLVWDWIDGQSLADWLATRPARAQRLHVARELVLLVESLHVAGIVHGALHARNVIRDPRGKLWLTHVSPLLMTDFQQDIGAAATVLRDVLGEETSPPSSSSLRQMRLKLAGLIESTAPADNAVPVAGEGRLRLWSILAAIACALLAGAVSFAIWAWVRR